MADKQLDPGCLMNWPRLYLVQEVEALRLRVEALRESLDDIANPTTGDDPEPSDWGKWFNKRAKEALAADNRAAEGET